VSRSIVPEHHIGTCRYTRQGLTLIAGSGHAFEEAENVADRDLGPLVGLTHSRYRCAPLLAV
jgi:hypothetical protein